MLFTIEQNAKYLNNFALLTAASDLLYMRITLKKSTIPTLLSCVDYEGLNLVGELMCCIIFIVQHAETPLEVKILTQALCHFTYCSVDFAQA